MHSENNRISITAKLALVVLLIAIFEGAIRKWISPGFGTILIGVRDCLAIISIFVSVYEKKEITTSLLFKLVIAWCFTVVIWGLFQGLINQTPIALIIIGIRFWLLYLLFAVLVGLSLTRTEFDYIVNWLLWITLLNTPLVVIQHVMPPEHFINKQLDNGSEYVFTVTKDIVRTTGTFSFTFGQTTFLALVTPLILGCISNKKTNNTYSILPWFVLFSIFVSVIVSGSRGAIILFLFIFVIYFLFEFLVLRKELNKSRVTVLIFIIMMFTLSPMIFSRAIDATLERFDAASENEDIVDRVVVTFAGEPFVSENMTWLGAGIGNGSNFAAIFLTGEYGFTLAETEPGRNLLEGGMFGAFFIIVKWLLFMICGFASFVLSLRRQNAMYIALCLTTFIANITWSITGQITANVLGNFLLLFLVSSFHYQKIDDTNS